jgi:hypothetical protein
MGRYIKTRLQPRQHGQGMIEYLIVTVMVTMMLFIPNPLTDNLPLADYMARAVRSYFRAYSFLLSVS